MATTAEAVTPTQDLEARGSVFINSVTYDPAGSDTGTNVPLQTSWQAGCEGMIGV